MQEWNLTAEYALTRTASLQVGYVGEKGDHIEDYGNLNQWKVNGDPTSAPYYNNQYLGVNGLDAALGVGPNWTAHHRVSRHDELQRAAGGSASAR